MAKYNIENVYKDISTINGYFREYLQDGLTIQTNNGSIDTYCHYGSNSGKGKCHDYYQRASSGVIYLLKNLEKYGLEYDKLAEYAILWLSYKLNIKPNNNITNLNEFYTRYIVNNKSYNEKINGDDTMTYKDIINKNKDLMNINIKEIFNFNVLFSILFVLHSGIKNKKVDCAKYSNYGENFANKIKDLNNDSSITENTLYRKLLFTLSDDYNNLLNKCTDFPPLPKIKTPPSKLIPALSTFSVIPVFLGIAYKYSLFGVDKLFQRQYLRKKLKKVKKKLKLNI
ncbi:PIR protein CIR protein [Plasmodium vinckei brucechwatti]|uniref:PIR protein CIR protein n=1 Tax=Plasmodium vinckei brucechwatti TaxID=119398 RepID=A0A6V7SKF5_PLAVN|nr:PIR protein CIR protein [Plasmodium vinckei brucechwatti]